MARIQTLVLPAQQVGSVSSSSVILVIDQVADGEPLNFISHDALESFRNVDGVVEVVVYNGTLDVKNTPDVAVTNPALSEPAGWTWNPDARLNGGWINADCDQN